MPASDISVTSFCLELKGKKRRHIRMGKSEEKVIKSKDTKLSLLFPYSLSIV